MKKQGGAQAGSTPREHGRAGGRRHRVTGVAGLQTKCRTESRVCALDGPLDNKRGAAAAAAITVVGKGGVSEHAESGAKAADSLQGEESARAGRVDYERENDIADSDNEKEDRGSHP